MVTKKSNQTNGFTIIELMIALTFIAFLLIFIVIMTMRITQMYSKGMTLKSINQSSRTIVDQMARDISASTQPETKSVDDGSNTILCTSGATYLWNPLSKIETGDVRLNNIRYKAGARGENIPVYLVRSTKTDVCADSGKVSELEYNHESNQELLSSSAAVININLSQIANNPKLKKLNVTLGTPDKTVYEPGQNICLSGSAGDFCATAEFERIIYVPYGQ